MKKHDPKHLLDALLSARLSEQAAAFYQSSRDDIASGTTESRFSQLLALASRHARRQPLNPSAAERQAADAAVAGWDPVDWNLLETLRVALVLSRTDLTKDSFAQAFEESFKFADEGELCALYRAVPLLPDNQRFTWRAGEGCRTNMVSVFRAVACDNPFPVTRFDDVAWQQLVMKALFIGVPLWRIYGLDQRLSPTLAVMALDYMDERHSAGRTIPNEAWMLLGPYWDERATHTAERALKGDVTERATAALAVGRAGRQELLASLFANETDPTILSAIEQATTGPVDAATFRSLLTNERQA